MMCMHGIDGMTCMARMAFIPCMHGRVLFFLACHVMHVVCVCFTSTCIHGHSCMHACMHAYIHGFLSISCYVSLLTCHAMSCIHVQGSCMRSLFKHGRVLVPDLISLLLRPTVAIEAGDTRQVTQGPCATCFCGFCCWLLLISPLVCGSSFWAPVNVVLGKCPGC